MEGQGVGHFIHRLTPGSPSDRGTSFHSGASMSDVTEAGVGGVWGESVYFEEKGPKDRPGLYM